MVDDQCRQAVREVMLRAVADTGPIRAAALWEQVSRQAGVSQPVVISVMWDLVSEDLLHYNAAAMVVGVGDHA